MLKSQKIIVLITLILITIPTLAFSLTLPTIGTKEEIEYIETENFRILYQAKLKESVPYIAEQFEASYRLLTRVLKHTPEGKTEVLYVDTLDDHNGASIPIPHNTIIIFAGAPGLNSSIDSPGDYLKLTIIHELTHMITMDMRRGFRRVLTKIFGKVVPVDIVSSAIALFSVSPVTLAPTWFLEGSAMWAETELTDRGRGRSTYSDMLFRNAVADDALLPYSKWYIAEPDWPYGDAAYHYGMKLIEYIHETSDQEEPVGAINDSVSRIFMFNIDNAFEKNEEKTLELLSEGMLAREKKIQQGKIGILMSVPVTKVKRLTSPKLNVSALAYAGDKIYILPDRVDQRRNHIYSYDPGTLETKKLSWLDAYAIGHINASRDGRFIYYTMLNLMDNEDIYYEVKRIDLVKKDEETITKEGRYREVAPSVDNKYLAAVSMRAGKFYLVELGLDYDGEPQGEKVLVEAPFMNIISGVEYSPDGNEILYVEAGSKGSMLKVFVRRTGKVRTVISVKSRIQTPTWHPNNGRIIFSFDKNGVFNLYEVSQNGGAATPLSNVIGGLFFPSFSADGLKIAAVAYDSKGFYTTLIDYSPESYKNNPLPVISHSWKGNAFATKKTQTVTEDEKRQIKESVAKSVATPKKYYSLMNLRPDYWTPWFFDNSTGFLASFSDPGEYLDIKLLNGIDIGHDENVAAINISYSGIKPEVNVYAYSDVVEYPGLLKEQGEEEYYDYDEREEALGISLEMPFLKFEHQIILTAGYEIRKRYEVENADKDYRDLNLDIEPTIKDQGLVWGRLHYFDGAVFTKSNSIEDGRLITLTGEWSDESFGGELRTLRVLGEWDEYISNPWVDNHVLKLSAAYGKSCGERFAQGMFQLGHFGSPVAYFKPGSLGSVNLRGYDSNFQTGMRVARLSSSYRFKIVDISKGFQGRFPIYSRQVFAEVFAEVGRTWDDNNEANQLGWIRSFGVEANFAMTLLRFVNFSPGIGIAYVPNNTDKDTENEKSVIYLSLKAWQSF